MRKSLVVFGLLAVAGLCASQAAAATQVTYLICTRGPQGSNDGSSVARVTLDPVTMHGNLDPVVLLAEYDHVDSAALTPDGRYLYFVDAYSYPSPQVLGRLDLSTVTYTGIGAIWTAGGEPFATDQAAFTLDGTLLVTNTINDSLYSVNPVTAEATLIGPVTTTGGANVDIFGGDILVSDAGELYLWTNSARAGAPVGLESEG